MSCDAESAKAIAWGGFGAAVSFAAAWVVVTFLKVFGRD